MMSKLILKQYVWKSDAVDWRIFRTNVGLF